MTKVTKSNKKVTLQEMLVLLIFLGSWCLAQGVNYRKLYKEAVIHFKDPDFEAGDSKYLSTEASDLLKDNAHFQAFKKIAQLVEKQNRKPGREWVAEINEFALETEEEFRSRHLGLNMTTKRLEETERQPRLKFNNADKKLREDLENKEVDYTPYLPPVTHQGNCGSCWAFSAVASMNYQVNKDRPVDGEMVALSEQQCIDCSIRGCDGGYEGICFDLGYYHFSHWASVYNYMNEYKEGKKCKYDEYKNGMSGFKFTNPWGTSIGSGDENVLYAVANRQIGVVSASLYVNNDFMVYKSGVFSHSHCNSGYAGHAVNIVGYGKLDGIPYWRVRNSWGTTWGEGGYINIKRGVNGQNLNMCGIASGVVYPNIEGKDDGQGSGTESEAIKLDCDRGKFSYRGTQNKTRSGRTCQRWDSQEPHPHKYTREYRPYAGLSENYCRNPSGAWQDYPWCYTTDPAVKYDSCYVPWCQLDWCKLSGKEFLSGLELKFDTLHRAKRNCGWKGDDCSGITQLIDGTYGLTTGVLYTTDKPVYGLTLQKGACKELDPPVGVYCEVKSVKLTGSAIRIYTKKSESGSVATLLEAKQLCTYIESCRGISGKEGAYYLHSNTICNKVSGADSWFKDKCPEGDECPDLTKCGTGKQADYRGNINTTASGKTCQRWDSQTPHSHTRTPEKYPKSGLEENFCRNPDGEGLEIFQNSLFSILYF